MSPTRALRRARMAVLSSLTAAGSLFGLSGASEAASTTDAARMPASAQSGAQSSATVSEQGVASTTSCAPGPVAPTTTTTTTTSTTTTSTSTTTTTSPTTTTTTPGSSTSTSTTTTVASSTTSAPPPTTTTIVGPTTTTTTPVGTPTRPSTYYLLTSTGAVDPFGGAVSFGSHKASKNSPAVVGGAATFDGGGYWLVTGKGGVYNYGDALYYGSTVHEKLAKPIVAMAPTGDGQGYWLADANGAIYNFGDATFCGSAIHRRLARPITGFSPTPDGQGYWSVTAGGAVFNYGDASYFGSHLLAGKRTSVVGVVSTPDGGGYWTASSSGAVYNFGDAGFFGSAIHVKLSRPIVSIAATPDGLGYWLTTSDGRIYNYGDAAFFGSLAHDRPRAPEKVVALLPAIAVPSATVVALPHHVFGYDISNYQCQKKGSTSTQANLPSTSAVSVLQAAGWLDSANNSCLAAETTWATDATGRATPYELYLFVNAPGSTASAANVYANGPKGVCASESGTEMQDCIAYNYGYNGAKNAYAYAAGAGAHSLIWWLDVENEILSPGEFSNLSKDEFWSSSASLNAETIQGAIDALHSEGLLVGIYSTSVQYPRIAGAYIPYGPRIPIWVAGVPWTNPPYAESGLASTSVLASWCAGTASYTGPPKTAEIFAGGVPWILQETPGNEPSPDGIDPDYTC